MSSLYSLVRYLFVAPRLPGLLADHLFFLMISHLLKFIQSNNTHDCILKLLDTHFYVLFNWNLHFPFDCIISS